ncbi:MAG: hypothetical protein WBP53_01920 [Dokdonella sp.]
MRTEADKAEVELAVFRRFIELARLPLDAGSERKGNADTGEPDVICTLGGELCAFELAETCAPEFAIAAANAAKSGSGVSVSWGSDVSHLSLGNKLTKRYSVTCPDHLLLYADGPTALPDEHILAALNDELVSGMGPFLSIWFYGSGIHKVR